MKRPQRIREIDYPTVGMGVSQTRGLPEVDVEPLGDLMLDFLIEHDKEETFLDFKETLSIARNAPFAKVAKDAFAFSNYGGGFLATGSLDSDGFPSQ